MIGSSLAFPDAERASRAPIPVPSRTGLLPAGEAVRVLNARPGMVTAPPANFDGRVIWHRPTGRAMAEYVPAQTFRVGCPPLRWFVLQDPAGRQRNYGQDYPRAIRHFEFLTREDPATVNPLPVAQWRAEADRVEATPAGREFVAAGWRMAPQGGNCCCWQRRTASGALLLISDRDGGSGDVDPADPADHYLVGLYDTDMRTITAPVYGGRSPSEALTEAARLAAYGGGF